MNQRLKNLIKYKDLFVELVKKDIKIKYKNSYIGIFWSMLNPLMMMIVLTVIFSSLFKNNIANFPVYVLTGRFVYTFLAESTNSAMDSVISNSQLIRKVYVPKYFFPVSRVCSSFITNTVALVPIIVVMATTGMSFSLINIYIVIPLFLLLIICVGLGMILSTVNVFFRDMKHLYSIILMVIMYSTAIFYPASIIPEKYIGFFELNPLFPIVRMLRDSLMYQTIPNYYDILISLLYAIILFIIGLFIFYKKQDRFIFYL